MQYGGGVASAALAAWTVVHSLQGFHGGVIEHMWLLPAGAVMVEGGSECVFSCDPKGDCYARLLV